MSVHQIIYTSCMRGINGINDGQQIFSYDNQFKDYNNDDIKSLFSYQPPALESGVIMTEEIAATLPQSFIFRKLEKGKCALSLSTYLGRDYMGSAGRFGNHLSHVVVADEMDFMNYPCEFYGGSLLRRYMEFEEVNNPNPPDFLPTPILEKGYIIDVDTVLEFLSIGDRLDIYKNMLCAMLAFEKERKRIVICDIPENIIIWIAALEYAVPLKMALDINFTTYEFDPSLSASQICGVVKSGTRYTTESKRQHFVFDLYQNDCVEFDKDSEFYDFIDTAFSLSFESIQDFHTFLVEGYICERANEELYSAYVLYSLLSDGLASVTKEKLKSALSFAEKYAKSLERVRIAKNVLTQYEEILKMDKWMFLAIMNYLFSVKDRLDKEEQTVIESVIVDRIFREFLNSENTEDIFLSFYNNTKQMCIQHEFSLVTGLMQESNQEKLLVIMQSEVRTWKIAFLIKVISMYTKEHYISCDELILDKPLGDIYYGIIMAAYSQNSQNGFFLVTCILNEFANDGAYLTNMMLNVEGMLLDLPNGEKEAEKLWKYYRQMISLKQREELAVSYHILGCYERYEQIFMLFELQIQEAADVATAKKVFDEHYKTFVQKNRTYASMYGQNILVMYYNKLGEYDTKQIKKTKMELFELIVDLKMDAEFSSELIQELLKGVPYESPSKQNLCFIQNAFHYIYNFKQQPITGKLLLLMIGMIIEEISSHQQVKEKIGQLEVLTESKKADLKRMSEKALKNYWIWVLPNACKFCRRNDEINMFYSLFDMSSSVRRDFFVECAKLYLKQCKTDKDYNAFIEYFDFVYEHSDIQIREDLGKVLCKLNKNKLAELDEIICETFHMNKQIIKFWEDIKETAETSNPMLNNISNLFRRKKKD